MSNLNDIVEEIKSKYNSPLPRVEDSEECRDQVRAELDRLNALYDNRPAYKSDIIELIYELENISLTRPRPPPRMPTDNSAYNPSIPRPASNPPGPRPPGPRVPPRRNSNAANGSTLEVDLDQITSSIGDSTTKDMSEFEQLHLIHFLMRDVKAVARKHSQHDLSNVLVRLFGALQTLASKDADCRAFQAKNPDCMIAYRKIELHGQQNPDNLESIVKPYLDEYQKMAIERRETQRVEFNAGKGKNSIVRLSPVIRPALISLCNKLGYSWKFADGNDGMVIVDILPK